MGEIKGHLFKLLYTGLQIHTGFDYFINNRFKISFS